MFFWWSSALQLKAIISHDIHIQQYTQLNHTQRNLQVYATTHILSSTHAHTMPRVKWTGEGRYVREHVQATVQWVNTNKSRARVRPQPWCQRSHRIGYLKTLHIWATRVYPYPENSISFTLKSSASSHIHEASYTPTEHMTSHPHLLPPVTVQLRLLLQGMFDSNAVPLIYIPKTYSINLPERPPHTTHTAVSYAQQTTQLDPKF